MELNHRMEDPDLDAEQGRGIYVVRALTDELSVRRVEERTVVRAIRRAILPA
jgi:anti-sigma regulatory factor (Ser/Thr protein kinase)